MGLLKIATLAKDVMLAGAKGFWETPVDTTNFVPLGHGAKRDPSGDGKLIARAMGGDSSVMLERPDIWAAYRKTAAKS